MRKLGILLAATAIFSTQIVFADDMMGNSTSCTTVANACLKAGYKGKKFWDDCMHPVLLDKTVNKIKLDAEIVKTCRTDKIAELKKLLAELESI